jgi:SHS2 domain-containing protein
MYEFLDHPSEAMVRVTAKTVNEVFEDAARALFELMTDIARVKAEVEFKIELTSDDKTLLLVDWLNRLIWIHEVENVFLCEFVVNVQDAWKLNATVKGQSIRSGVEKRLHAKSATYGQLEWNETPQGHKVQFVVDI